MGKNKKKHRGLPSVFCPPSVYSSLGNNFYSTIRVNSVPSGSSNPNPETSSAVQSSSSAAPQNETRNDLFQRGDQEAQETRNSSPQHPIPQSSSEVAKRSFGRQYTRRRRSTFFFYQGRPPRPYINNQIPSTAEVEQMHTSNGQQDTSIPSSQPDVNDNPLQNLKLCDFLNEICTREGVTEDNICHVFFKDFISKLFGLKDDLPIEIHPLIYKIISYLAHVGVQFNEENESEINQENSESGDARLNNVVRMLRIDLKIEELMKLKKRLYSRTLVVNQNDLARPIEIACKEERERLLRMKEEILTHDDMARPSTVNDIRNKDLLGFDVQENESRSSPVVEQSINNDNTEVASHSDAPVEKNEVLSVDDDQRPTKRPKLKRFKLPNVHQSFQSSEISCISCFKNLCLLGLSNGKISVALCINNMVPADDATLFFFSSPHTDSIVFIETWNNLVISISKDKTFTKFNWRLKKSEQFHVGETISSVDVNEGVLFIGTTSGYFGQIVLSNLVYKLKLTQLVQSPIKSLKVTVNSEGEKFMVLLTDEGATLRETSGILLHKFCHSENLESITVTFPWEGILYGKESNELYAGKNDVNQRIPLPYTVTLIDSYDNMIVVGGYQENKTNKGFITFYSHDLHHELESYQISDKPVQCIVISKRRVIVLTASRSVISLFVDLTNVEPRMFALPFLSK